MSGKNIFRTLVMVCAIAVLYALSSCGNGNGDYSDYHPDNDYAHMEGIEGTTLVIYSTLASSFTTPIINMFEERYGVTVELYQSSTAQTLARLHAESANPHADIMLGGNIFALTPHLELFEEFTSVNEAYMLPGHANSEGNITRLTTAGGVIIVNTSLAAGIEIRGYECLLNPALYGQIAIAYPSAAPLSFMHLVNQLYAMGSGNPHAGWEYVEQFIINTGGIILQNLDEVHTGVSGGDFIVGLTYDEAFFAYAETAPHVEMIYMYEGMVSAPTGISIVSGAVNREAAAVFINFITSYEIQAYMQANLHKRAAHSGVTADIPALNPAPDWLPANTAYILEHLNPWIEQFWDLWMAHN